MSEIVDKIRLEVAGKIAGAGSDIFNQVAKTLAQSEIEKRVALVLQVMTERDNLTRDLKKVKPDNVTYDIDGKVISESYNKDTLEKRKKLLERLAKIDKALSDALELNEYDKLKNLGDNKSA